MAVTTRARDRLTWNIAVNFKLNYKNTVGTKNNLPKNNVVIKLNYEKTLGTRNNLPKNNAAIEMKKYDNG